MLAVAALTAVLAGCGSAPASEPSSSRGTERGSAVPPPSPTAPPTPSPTPQDETATRLAAMTVREKLATMLMLHHPGTDPAPLAELMRATGAGGFIVMGSNVAGNASDVAPLTAALTVDQSLPPLVAVDQEGGVVSRLAEDGYPAGRALAALPPEATREAFAKRAALVRSAGIGMNFGIVADLTEDRSSFIAGRILGQTPEESALRVEQAVAGESGVVLSTLKHFPGHGLTGADSHVSVPASDIGWDAWRAGAAVPFERGIAAGAEAVMFGHLKLTAVDSVPASLSARWHEVLREDLDFDGLAVTDDMLMLQHSGEPAYADPLANAIAAIGAGNDLLVYVLAADPAVSGVDPHQLLTGLETAVADGRIPEARLDESVERLLDARIALRDGL